MYDATDLARDRVIEEMLCEGNGASSEVCHTAHLESQLGRELYAKETQRHGSGLFFLIVLLAIIAIFWKRKSQTNKT